MSNTWLGRNAVLWALDEAPGLPANLVATLIALARYADQDGRGAHPSAATIAAHIRKTEGQAKRDLAALQKLGLISRGNQRSVAHIRRDRRPVAYDLAMPRGSTDATPSARNGVAPVQPRGSTQARHGVAPMPPEEIRNTSGIGERDAESATAPLARAADPTHISATVDQLRRALTANRKPGACTDSDMQDVTRELAAIDAALDAFVLDSTPLA